jgi:hypothetical protein
VSASESPCTILLANISPTQPWYLSTFAVAEQLYDAVIVWEQQQVINVTSTSLLFFRQFISDIGSGSYPASTSTYSTLLAAIKSFADGFVLVNAKYTPSDGGLAEQFNRDNGTPLSAKDLTWSYASALTAFAARGGFIPASWGAAGLTVPSVCRSNPGPTASVTFNVYAPTNPGGERGNPSFVGSDSTGFLSFDRERLPCWFGPGARKLVARKSGPSLISELPDLER